jgi:hypothetical protein
MDWAMAILALLFILVSKGIAVIAHSVPLTNSTDTLNRFKVFGFAAGFFWSGVIIAVVVFVFAIIHRFN